MLPQVPSVFCLNLSAITALASTMSPDRSRIPQNTFRLCMHHTLFSVPADDARNASVRNRASASDHASKIMTALRLNYNIQSSPAVKPGPRAITSGAISFVVPRFSSPESHRPRRPGEVLAMLSPAGSTSTGTPSFFQIRSISCSRSSFRFFFSARSHVHAHGFHVLLPWHCRHIPLRSKPPAAGSPPGALLPEPADESPLFQTMDRTGCKISCSPYHDQIFLFIFAVFLLSFQQPPFSSVFRGLPRYSRARITLFPLIKIQERARFVNVSP